MTSRITEYWLELMVSLYYPAVLGTGLVLLLFKVANADSPVTATGDITVYFGAMMMLFFSVSFLIIKRRIDEGYSAGAGLLDTIEIILLFLAFYFLGYLSNPPSDPPQWRNFYLVMTSIPVVQQLWCHAVGASTRWPLALAASGVFVLAAVLCRMGLWVHITVLILMVGLFAQYVGRLKQR